MPVELKSPPTLAGVPEAYVPDQSRGERRTSYDLADFPVPNGREEDWRFTPVDRLQELFQQAPSDVAGIKTDIQVPAGIKVSEVPAGDPLPGLDTTHGGEPES